MIYADLKGNLTPAYEYPDQLKTKAVYFSKPEEMSVTKENMTKLLRGDMSYG